MLLFNLCHSIPRMAFEHYSGFAKPLAKDKEHACFVRLIEGDERMAEVLVHHNMRLVAHVAKRYQGVVEEDEMLSVGSIGLLKAVRSFHPDRGTQFSTYAAKCIENEILMYIRANKHNRQNVSLYQPIGVDKEGNEVTLIDTLSFEGDEVGAHVEAEECAGLLSAAIGKVLSAREKRVILLRYGLFGKPRLPQRTIAEREGISRSYVSRIEKKALGKLRVYLVEVGYTNE